MQNNSSDFVSRSQIDSWYGTDTLSVQNYVLRTDTVSSPQCVPGCVDIRVQIFFRRLPTADTVTRVVVAEDVTIDTRTQSQVEAAHLTNIYGVAMRKQNRKSSVSAALDEHTSDSIATRHSRIKPFDVLSLAVAILPFGFVQELDLELGRRVFRMVANEFISGFRRKEGQFGSDLSRARRAAE